jgi:TPR repeat protein
MPIGGKNGKRESHFSWREDYVYEEAAQRYGQAAAQGDADTQRMLGDLHSEGKGVPQDYAEAARLYGLAAAQGDATAQLKLIKLSGWQSWRNMLHGARPRPSSLRCRGRTR